MHQCSWDVCNLLCANVGAHSFWKSSLDLCILALSFLCLPFVATAFTQSLDSIVWVSVVWASRAIACKEELWGMLLSWLLRLHSWGKSITFFVEDEGAVKLNGSEIGFWYSRWQEALFNHLVYCKLLPCLLSPHLLNAGEPPPFFILYYMTNKPTSWLDKLLCWVLKIFKVSLHFYSLLCD